MAAKFKLVPAGTFELPILITTVGQEKPTPLKFTFKRMPLTELKDKQDEMVKRVQALDEQYKAQKLSTVEDSVLQYPIMADFVMEIASGWELQHEFNRENLITLFDNYPTAFTAISVGYQAELWRLRQKP
ncbi:tail length tape measure protein [Klebsiella phage EKq1]|uniref:Phage protein n=1 Tax=Klebsiella phage PMBT64 TaxID=3229740 RepID=A0AB39C364_9CAUD|nr:hypothetical protein HSE3_gp039 [Klebsiella phage vB_KleS-HSE3]WNA09113.1 hypothetical protein [Klebsiella phage P61_2]WNV46685.1 tail length tape measure protein [Klebsiella phage EKq1]BEH84617.1 phage tail assembly chaperone [Klebsiella phage phiKp_7-2]